jgi:tetratricopeptide (TPR) repeat protein
MVLGVLYVNTSPEFVIAAEKEFVKALEAAKGKPQPSAHSGLCFAYYYQGKFKEAVEQADKYLALVPDDEALKQLRKIAFEKASGGEPPRTIETGLAQQSVSFAENSIAASGSVMRFAPPDDAHWKLTKKEYDKKRGAGRIVYKHLPIKDPQGHEIEPLMAVIFEEMSAFLDAGTYSESERAQKSMDWQEKRKFTSQDGSLSYPNAEGYDGEYTVQGVIHKIIVAYMVHKELGVQIICDSTDGVYDKVESDFRAFIKSINFE